VLAAVVAAAAALVACSSPPQVVGISPTRGAVDVRSSDAITIQFDRPMDRASVAVRFHVEPQVQGAVSWASDHALSFEHVPFDPSSRYQVVLDAGYRDAHGDANSLRHSWTFRTEAAPTLTGAAPGPGDRDIDPASYLTLTFSREMDAGSLVGAISLVPSSPFVIHLDAGDPRRVVLTPQSLLEPRTGYEVTVSRDARDVDGNRLGADAAVAFTTGDFRPLRHWVGFIAETAPGSGGFGLWIVDENRLPRRLVSSPVSSFSWSADGSRLLLHSPTGTWTDQPLAGASAALPFQGEWADYLAPGLGYAFLDQGGLKVLRPDGSSAAVAGGVTEATVAPGGERLAFVTRDPSGPERAAEIDGYDAVLRARYRLQTEAEPVDGLAWSPDGQSLAYRLDAVDAAHRQVRVVSMRDGGTVTVATGDVSAPAWQAGGQHVFFTATVTAAGGTVTKAFRAAVTGGAPFVPSAATGMPGDQGVDVESLSPSVDGHQLAFVSDSGGRPGVWTMNADGTGLTQLTGPDPDSFPYSARAVSWTPT
jgi:hypothetical protein